MVTGVDCSPTAIKHGRKNLAAAGLQADLHVGDVCNIDFAKTGVPLHLGQPLLPLYYRLWGACGLSCGVPKSLAANWFIVFGQHG